MIDKEEPDAVRHPDSEALIEVPRFPAYVKKSWHTPEHQCPNQAKVGSYCTQHNKAKEVSDWPCATPTKIQARPFTKIAEAQRVMQVMREALVVTRVTIVYPLEFLNEQSDTMKGQTQTTKMGRDIFEQYRAAKLNPMWKNEVRPKVDNPAWTCFIGVEIDSYPDKEKAASEHDKWMGGSDAR